MCSHQDHSLAVQRKLLTGSIDEVAEEIGIELRNAGLNFPVYITVRRSGDSLATIATPDEPLDIDWRRASEIACKAIGKKVGCDRLRGQELACAVANAARVTATEVGVGDAG